VSDRFLSWILPIVALSAAIPAVAQSPRHDELANASFVENRPTPETAKLLKDELLFQRATQVYLWAMPVINTLGMKVGSEKQFGAGCNVLPVWKSGSMPRPSSRPRTPTSSTP
jgi:hypothetical protein